MVPVAVLCDLDGVVWLARQAIPGAAEAIARLRAAGSRVLFVTNNSAAPIAEQEQALADIDIPAVGDVVTSAMAAAHLVQPGERALVCGGPGITEALVRRGVEAVPGSTDDPGGLEVDAVIVGFHMDFDYTRLRIATSAVLAGADLIGTNDDPTYPTPAGPIPGGGSLLAAVATASGAIPVVAGKPYAPMATTVLELLGSPDPSGLVMVGDRPSTDGRFAAVLGAPFALVRSGVTRPGEPVDVPVAIDVPDLAAVAETLLSLPPPTPV